MDTRAGPELSCGRADTGAAPTSRQQQQQRQQQQRADDSESERQPREPSPTGMESRAGLELSGGRADAGAALTSQLQQRDQRVEYKRKRSANVTEVSQGKKARACEDDSESERQVRGPSPTGMDSLTGPEPSCSRVDAGAAPAPAQARARADDSESERQLRVPSPTGMDTRAGPEPSCNPADANADLPPQQPLELSCYRAGANAAPVPTQTQQPEQNPPFF